MDTKILLGALIAVAGVGVGLAAQDAQEAGAPSPEMMRAMSPGPMHAKLEPLIGSWAMVGQWRTAADAPWDEFAGTVEREWILDGRFVREEVDSEWMGQPFEGIGLFGHDNVREQFTMVWLDNASTGAHSSSGRMDDAGKLVLEGENSDPMTGEKNKWGKTEIDLSDADEHVFEMWTKGVDGEPFVSMKMTLTRN